MSAIFMATLIALASAAAPPTNTTSSVISPASAAAMAAKQQANDANGMFFIYFFIIMASLVVGFATWRIVLESTKYVRTLTCLNNPTQNFFVNPSQSMATFKDSLLYAPVFSKRHNREFQLSKAMNMGTLPTRFQLFFLLAYLGTNVAFCVVSIHWDLAFIPVAKEFRNRTGILAMVNMIPLFLMAGRNNPLINLLGISFDSFNLLHRFFGRVVVVQALLHTGAWMASTFKSGGWAAVLKSLNSSAFIIAGLIVSLTP